MKARSVHIIKITFTDEHKLYEKTFLLVSFMCSA